MVAVQEENGFQGFEMNLATPAVAADESHGAHVQVIHGEPPYTHTLAPQIMK